MTMADAPSAKRPEAVSQKIQLVGVRTRSADILARVRAVSVSVRPCSAIEALVFFRLLMTPGSPRREGVLRSLALPQDDTTGRSRRDSPTASQTSPSPRACDM